MNALKTILGRIRQADQNYTLFENNDRILIGVSGGKDSMALAYALNIYQKFNFVNFKIIPAILDLGFDGFDASKISEYFASIGLKLEVVDAKDVYPILKEQQKEYKHLPCSICSRMKKAAINKIAKELHCNKVAFAHHADDAIETLFMNEIYGGRVATFQPKMHLERANIHFIRPLILAREKEIKELVKEMNIPIFSSHCPNDGITKRAEMKTLLDEIYEQYPSSYNNFLTMLNNYEKQCLFYNDIHLKIENIDISFKPVINASDAYIEIKLREELKLPKRLKDDKISRYIIFKKNKPIGIFSSKILQKDLIEIKDYAIKELYVNKYYDVIHKAIIKEINRKINPIIVKG